MEHILGPLLEEWEKAKFVVHPEIFERFPGLRIAIVVVSKIDNCARRPSLEALWRSTWEDAAADGREYGSAQAHARVQPWRKAMRAYEVSGHEFPPSVEALLRQALENNDPYLVNPVVDFYNSVSLRHMVPVGGYDLGQIKGPLELRLTRYGDTFQALDEPYRVSVPPGEVAYADGSTILTRHFVWRQARVGLISEATESVLMVSEVLRDVGEEVANDVLSSLESGLAEHFGVRARATVINEDRLRFSW